MKAGNACSGGEGGTGGFFMKTWNDQIVALSSVAFASHAIWNAANEAEDSYRVRSVKHLRLELNLESFRHFSDVSGHIIVVVLRPVSRGIQTVVHGRL